MKLGVALPLAGDWATPDNQIVIARYGRTARLRSHVLGLGRCAAQPYERGGVRLLPERISGELRVKDVGRFVPESAE